MGDSERVQVQVQVTSEPAATAGKMGATTYLVPTLVVVMSWAILGETPQVLTFAGGALCLAGVAISRRRGASG